MSTRPVALVTGANKGVGYGIAKVLYGKGWSVVLACRSEERAKEAVDKIRASAKAEADDHRVDFVLLDLMKKESIAPCVAAFQKLHSRLDALCNNAGVSAKELGRTVMYTNFINMVGLTEALMPMLKTQHKRADGSTLVNRFVMTGSRGGQIKLNKFTGAGQALCNGPVEAMDTPTLLKFAEDYMAAEADGTDGGTGFTLEFPCSPSKALMNCYARLTAMRFAKEGVPITVNCGCPGLVDTDQASPLIEALSLSSLSLSHHRIIFRHSPFFEHSHISPPFSEYRLPRPHSARNNRVASKANAALSDRSQT